jgi:hypothetical protein
MLKGEIGKCPCAWHIDGKLSGTGEFGRCQTQSLLGTYDL